MVGIRAVGHVSLSDLTFYSNPTFLVHSNVAPTDFPPDGAQFMPRFGWWSPDQVCGVNGTKTGHGAKTAVVEAGSEVGFLVARATYEPYVTPHVVSVPCSHCQAI